MAIAFARIEFVSRSKGASACNSSAYNARSIVAILGINSVSGQQYFKL